MEFRNVDGTTIVNSFAVLLLGNTCTTGLMLPPAATITVHGLLPRPHDVCATYTVIHIVIVIVIVFVIKLYHNGWSILHLFYTPHSKLQNYLFIRR